MPEISFDDYMYEIHTNGLFTSDHFDIAINEVKLKHIEESNNFLINGANMLAKVNTTKVQLLHSLKSLEMKHRYQMESFLILNEIKNRSQYIGNHESSKSLTYLKYELLKVDFDNKNKMITNSNLIIEISIEIKLL